MLALFIFPVLVCLAAADPDPEPVMYAVDGVKGLIYEIPEYEDPELTMFQLSAMGAMPVLTVLEMDGNAEDSPNEEDIAYYEQLAEVKRGLDEVIARLHVARSKLTRGNTHIFIDIDKSVQNLKKLSRHLRADVYSFGTSIRQSVSFTSDADGTGFNTDGEMSFTTQTPVSPESSDFENSRQEKKIETPFGDSVIITESRKIEDGDKSAVQKKWTWKSIMI